MFTAEAGFNGATFSAGAWFIDATFAGAARFDGAMFAGKACFSGATFATMARFPGATFDADALFIGTTFATAGRLGPLACRGLLELSAAVFGAPMTVEAAATSVRCVRTQWEATATLRLRYATVVLSNMVVTQPMAVAAHPAPFDFGGGVVGESGPTCDPGVRIASLRGVDAAHLGLTDTDLTGCVFTGAFHRDVANSQRVFDQAPRSLGTSRAAGREAVVGQDEQAVVASRRVEFGAPRCERLVRPLDVVADLGVGQVRVPFPVVQGPVRGISAMFPRGVSMM
ncbi:pentapeptide repeat-containing protein [Embleya sp. NBC_00888]|uniref:pentapeptide repeat-containing protein n=1 Tax=Embleya sp. NBC_00888 TaxID=2975960 RepID=UPI0038666F04|nr:pentapeptide repeat-containing protein [Embleya sp. NBC_00888]